MADLTNPPFTRQPGAPAFYLRELSRAELAQVRRMIERADRERREYLALSGKR
jgi:hypothetical protein